ncbi:MAG: helix-turn-helix transcriptional regulator [Eubacterium sp.]|nr:helix-turn-helix transcriptional regulator [Eubacterium sp.]
MGRKKNEHLEFRFYDPPRETTILPVIGDKWIRKYGSDEDPLHFHNLFEIGICHEGTGTFYLDKEVIKYEPGQVTIVPPDFPHKTVSEGISFWEYLFIDFAELSEMIYSENETEKESRMSILGSHAIVLSADDKSGMKEIVTDVISEFKTRKPFFKETVDSLSRVLFYKIMRLQKEQGTSKEYELSVNDAMLNDNFPHIKPALNYIEQHYSEPMKIKELADSCNLSETHFRRIFAEYVNMPPVDYLNLVRVQKACSIMRRTKHSMDQVAIECGFASTTTFNRNFKKFLGISPYQWKINSANYKSKLQGYKVSALRGW